MPEDIIYTCTAIITCSALLIPQMRYIRRNRDRLKFLTQLEEYLTRLRHNFSEYSNIADAVFFSRDPGFGMLGSLMAQMDGIFSTVAVSDECSMADADPYEKLLVCVCRLTEEYGEGQNGVSFSDSILKLLMDVREERRHLKKKGHSLRGLILMAVLPSLAVTSIGNWGIQTIPSLADFYHGRTGSIIRLLILALTVIVSRTISIISDETTDVRLWRLPARLLEKPAAALEAVWKKRTEKIHRLLKKLNIKLTVREVYAAMIGVAVVVLAAGAVTVSLGHWSAKERLLSDVSDLEMRMGVADSAELLHLQGVIPGELREAIAREERPSVEELSLKLASEQFRNPDSPMGAAVEIVRRFDAYFSEEIDFRDAALLVLMMAAAFWIPYVSLVLRESFYKSRIREEVMHFETVIDIEKDIPGIALPVILESIYEFAGVTAGGFLRCINEYNISEERAFDNLLEYCEDNSFARLLSFFRMTDILGIRGAFGEIASELQNMREDRKLERSLKLDDEKLLCGLLAVMPGGLIVFGYLLVPFLVRSLEMFNSYQATLGGMA